MVLYRVIMKKGFDFKNSAGFLSFGALLASAPLGQAEISLTPASPSKIFVLVINTPYLLLAHASYLKISGEKGFGQPFLKKLLTRTPNPLVAWASNKCEAFMTRPNALGGAALWG